MATLQADFSLPLRAFALELALDVSRTVALVGPSGAGKTSALRVVAGLLEPSRGLVSLDGERWLDTERGLSLPPERRRVGLVFQDYALFPHLSVRANVAFGAGGRPVDALLERFRIGRIGVLWQRWRLQHEHQRRLERDVVVRFERRLWLRRFGIRLHREQLGWRRGSSSTDGSGSSSGSGSSDGLELG